jgi:tRNA(Ile)-lysidine synthase
MSGPAPAVAQTRTAVRHALHDLRVTDASLALVACSGGADSLALAAAAAFAGPRIGWRIGLITVDHGLQPGSASRAEAVASWARSAGLDPVSVATITVDPADPTGPEAAARHARYEALQAACGEYAAAALLLGHTLDDQAETVLLALARGAGPRGLSGMPARRDTGSTALLRPMLGLRRSTLREACKALGLTPWEDPHNADSRYARARVRAAALPSLTAALGPGVAGNLAETARQLAVDSSYLDELAAAAYPGCVRDGGLDVEVVRALPAALRGRVLHAWALACGATAAALGHRHVAALDALITHWHGQGATALPSGLEVHRRDGLLLPVR